MTLPDERYRSVMWAKNFLIGLAYDRKTYPRISQAVRSQAHNILRHFPSEYDMRQASEAAPGIFQPKMDPLHRLIVQHEQDSSEVKS